MEATGLADTTEDASTSSLCSGTYLQPVLHKGICALPKTRTICMPPGRLPSHMIMCADTTPSTPRNQTALPLLRLSPELRNPIWFHLFNDNQFEPAYFGVGEWRIARRSHRPGLRNLRTILESLRCHKGIEASTCRDSSTSVEAQQVYGQLPG